MVQQIVVYIDDNRLFSFFRYLEKIRKIRRPSHRLHEVLEGDNLVNIQFRGKNKVSLTMKMRADDLYVIGFERDIDGLWEVIAEKEKGVLEGSKRLTFSINYPSLKPFRFSAKLLSNAVRFLKDAPNLNKNSEATHHFTLIAVMLAGTARFRWISYPIYKTLAKGKFSEISLDSDLRLLINSWSRMSKIALLADKQDITELSVVDVAAIDAHKMDVFGSNNDDVTDRFNDVNLEREEDIDTEFQNIGTEY